ncbi:MAG: hypothetical protein KDD11_23135 [Acidobacteria bacterium]|nr:hypothetical protein [Acidobacteriota bacterium]
MHILDEATVARSWNDTSRLSSPQTRESMHALAREQPALLGFVLAATEGLSKSAHSLANVLYFQIARLFDSAAPGPVPRVSEERLATLFEWNLEDLSEDSPDDAAPDEPWSGTGQPHLLRRVLESLFEAPELDESGELDEEEIGHLFVVLKTVVDALDEVTPAVPA